MSSFIKDQKEAASSDEYERRLQIIQEINSKCAALTAEELPPVEMMNVIGSFDASHFRANMLQFFNEFYWRRLLSPNSHVLDLGCGCGRLAMPISMLLESGKYYGIDVWKDGIEWCRSNISARRPAASFYLAEANNNYYFEARTNAKNIFSVPFAPSESIDFAFAISLFSHLVYDDALSYYRDVARALKPGGVLYVTGFVIDKFFSQFQRETGQHAQLQEDAEGCFYAYSGQDFFAGFSPAKWQELFAAAGLEVLSFELGSWALKPGARPYQDTFVVAKPTGHRT